VLHLLVFAHALATGGAGRTNFGTDSAGFRVELRFAEHEIDAFLAARGAVDQHLNVICSNVLTTLLKTIGEGGDATLVTFGAVRDASLHLARGHSHGEYPFVGCPPGPRALTLIPSLVRLLPHFVSLNVKALNEGYKRRNA